MTHTPQKLPSAELRSVLVWRPSELDSPLKAPGVLKSACCRRSTIAVDRAVVYRTMSDQGIVGIYDFLSDADRRPDKGWAAVGILHRLDPYLPRADLLMDEHLVRVFAHIQGRRTIPVPAAHRLMSLLPNPPFAARPEPLREATEVVAAPLRTRPRTVLPRHAHAKCPVDMTADHPQSVEDRRR